MPQSNDGAIASNVLERILQRRNPRVIPREFDALWYFVAACEYNVNKLHEERLYRLIY